MMKATGWCWSCGRAVSAQTLFCTDKCRRQYEREQRAHEIDGVEPLIIATVLFVLVQIIYLWAHL